MTRHLLFRLSDLIVCLLFLATSSWAWGPRSKPTSYRFYTTSVLKAKDSHYDGDESIIIEAYRAKLLTFHETSSSSASPSDGMSAMDFVKDRADELAAETFGVAQGFSESIIDSCAGGDCDECVIPNEWKISDEDRFDVLDFLGIQRAEPLRKIGDWE